MSSTESQTPEGGKPEGLRARKRRATENAIEMAGTALALELGIEDVTVETICDQAGISRSTFFNYFSSRDHAIMGRAIVVPEGPEAFAVLDRSPDDLPLGIFRLVFAAIGHSKVNADVARRRARLVRGQPLAARILLSTLLESSMQLTATAATWLALHPERARLGSPEIEASLAVTLVNGVLTTRMSQWMMGSGDVDADEADFAEAMAQYRALLG